MGEKNYYQRRDYEAVADAPQSIRLSREKSLKYKSVRYGLISKTADIGQRKPYRIEPETSVC